MDDRALERLVRDLIAMGVGLELGRGGAPPDLTVPEVAEAMVRNNLDLIRANHDRLAAVWAEAAVEKPVPSRWSECGECGASVCGVRPAWRSKEYVGWAFCESLFCPYRTDARATAFRKDEYQMRELARQRRAKLLADDPTAAEPIPE